MGLAKRPYEDEFLVDTGAGIGVDLRTKKLLKMTAKALK